MADSQFVDGRQTGVRRDVWRITAKRRMVAKLKAIKAELQPRKRHRTSEVGAIFIFVCFPPPDKAECRTLGRGARHAHSASTTRVGTNGHFIARRTSRGRRRCGAARGDRRR